MTEPSAHILVLEDEELTRSLMASYLERQGFRVSQAWDGSTMRAALDASIVDLVLLDIELPGEDGFQLLGQLRARSDARVVFVTRRGDVGDRVRGLELGGDDYVVKPVDLRELLARVRAQLRRGGVAPTRPETDDAMHFGDWVLRSSRRCLISAAGEQHALSPGEVAILETLVAARGDLVPREALLEALARAGVAARSLDVLVHRLRRKLGEGGSVVPRVLVMVYGVGYRVGVPCP